MARILLILPHLPQRMGAPYLGQQYVAAALLSDGHQVRCLDMAAVMFRGGHDDAVAAAQDFEPHIIGMTLFTYNALAAYRLAAGLRDSGALLVAGGPHPTVRSQEVLAHGFDLAVSGEGEPVIRHIAAAVDSGLELTPFAGLGQPGLPRSPSKLIDDLDSLPVPSASLACFDHSVYSDAGAHTVPGGMMTSRGCPARCTFCANYVTGRSFRWRSAPHVINEMIALREQHNVRHFPFWDDAFTARRDRLYELCDAIKTTPELAGCSWSCITPGNMVKPRDLARMRDAGCININFGIESGDYNVLKSIRKGQRPEQVEAAVSAAKREGMTTVVNFMFGFPIEGVAELNNTLEFMDRLAPHTDFFNNRGVLVPFPGTSIYDESHSTYGFTDWWLNDRYIPVEPDYTTMTYGEMQAALETDPTLALDFFHYEPKVRDAIEACVRYKAQHNARKMCAKAS